MNAPASDSLIEYPSRFPIKVMGANVDGFVDEIVRVTLAHDPGFDAETLATRVSAAGNYLGITVTITATSRAQLDAIYQALSTHPMVKVVL